MKFEIRRVQNGAVLRVEPEGDDSSEETVYQEQEGGEIEAFADFLRHLVDHRDGRQRPDAWPRELLLR